MINCGSSGSDQLQTLFQSSTGGNKKCNTYDSRGSHPGVPQKQNSSWITTRCHANHTPRETRSCISPHSPQLGRHRTKAPRHSFNASPTQNSTSSSSSIGNPAYRCVNKHGGDWREGKGTFSFPSPTGNSNKEVLGSVYMTHPTPLTSGQKTCESEAELNIKLYIQMLIKVGGCVSSNQSSHVRWHTSANWYSSVKLSTRLLYSSEHNFYSTVRTNKKQSTLWLSSARLSAKLVPTFADRGYHVVSATDPHGRILCFLDRSRYYFFLVAPQLYSWGWVDPVPDPLLLGKSGSEGNRTRDLWICSQVLWPRDHRGGLSNFPTLLQTPLGFRGVTCLKQTSNNRSPCPTNRCLY
jgi:hypothetical protein